MEALNETIVYEIAPKEFCDEHQEFTVPKVEVDEADRISIVEFAPKLFRNIRRSLLSEESILECLIPAANYHAIHNFQTG